MLTKVLALVLVVLISLALGAETARYAYAHAIGVDVTEYVVNIHHVLGFSLLVLATSGALLLSISREWFEQLAAALGHEDALDDAAKTACTSCGRMLDAH